MKRMRAGLITIVAGTVLLASAPANAGTIFEDETFLFNCGATGGSAKRRVRFRDGGREDLRIEMQDVQPGVYDVIVNGMLEGRLNATAGFGQLEFDTQPGPGELRLDFDPLDEIDLFTSGGTIAFSLSDDAECQNGGSGGGTGSSTSTSFASSSSTSSSSSSSSSSSTSMPSSSSSSTSIPTSSSSSTTLISPPPGGCAFIENEVFLLNCSSNRKAKGKRRVRERSDCQKDLRVEIQNVAKGNYDVWVGGARRGTISVVSRGQGQIEWDSHPDQPGELLLNFDPWAEVDVKVPNGSTTLFSLSPGCS